MAAQTLTVAKPSPRWGWALALGSTFFFSIAPPLASAGISQGINPLTLLMLRLTITTAFLAATIFATDRQLFKINRFGLFICLLGGLSNGLGMITFFQSLTLIHTSIASMIYSVSPLVTLGLLALRGERFTYRQSVRVALGLAGLYLLIGLGGQVSLAGALLAAVSAFTVPFMTVLMQWYLGQYDSRTVTFYTVIIMALTVTVWWAVSGAEWHPLTSASWLLVLALALATYLARIAMFAGIKRIGGGEVGLLAPLETFLTVVWSILFLGDTLTLQQWLGGGLILISAFLAAQRLGRVKWNTANGT